MKKITFVVLTIIFIICIASGASASEASFVVKLKDISVPDSLLNILTEVNADHRIYTVDNLESLADYGEYIEYTEENTQFNIIDEPLPLESSDSASLMSLSDPFYNRMWQLQTVNAEYPWDVLTYGNGVNVAVIDSGCYYHSDLKEALCGGYNVMTGEDETDYSDNHGHGTHVAGIIAAQHNTIGVAGIAPKVNLYAIKITDTGTGIALATIADAIYVAVDKFDCRVINMSLAGPSNNTTLYEAVKYAYGKGVIMIGAAGNEGEKTNGTRLMYPAAYDEVIGVGAVTDENKRADFSQRNNSVFVCAPGYEYISTYKGGKYGTADGTSQASPIVAAAAAIMLSADPDMTFEEFKSYIEDTALPLEDDYTGCGLINIGAMLEAYMDTQDIYISPRNEYSVYVKNNTSERVNILFRVNNTGEESATRVAAGKGRTADFLQGKGKLFFWTDYLRPFCRPKEYTIFKD